MTDLRSSQVPADEQRDGAIRDALTHLAINTDAARQAAKDVQDAALTAIKREACGRLERVRDQAEWSNASTHFANTQRPAMRSWRSSAMAHSRSPTVCVELPTKQRRRVTRGAENA